MRLPAWDRRFILGEILLEEFLKPLEMTQAAAAKTLGVSTVRLNELVRGKRGVTADTALRLAKLFKTSPQFWMRMQADFDLKGQEGPGDAACRAGRASWSGWTALIPGFVFLILRFSDRGFSEPRGAFFVPTSITPVTC